MGMMRLAFFNFRSSFKQYLSLVISLGFTILVFLNFQNISCSGAFEVLGSHNQEYVDMLIQVISFVLGCFMFFFIGYSTNVFLTKRKKEIGIYVFMGLSNQEIGKLYAIEITMTGIAALILGVAGGILTTGLFQMILLAISDIAVEIHFRVVFKPVLVTAGFYMAVYLFFVGRGYQAIVRSSVLNLLSASRQNEYVRQNVAVLLLKAMAGTAVLVMGYYLAVKEGGQEVLGNALAAVVFVTVGVYLLFGGLIPLIFQGLAKNKRFLYRGQRILWVNHVIFRMKKNYRTYAMVSVLMLCSVTALATGFAMKERYQNIIRFENTYTFQLLSSRDDLEEKARTVLEEDNQVTYSTAVPFLFLDRSAVESEDFYNRFGILSYSSLRKIAKDTGLAEDFSKLAEDFPKPADDEVIKVSHLTLMSLITERSGRTISIGGKEYRQILDTTVPYLGYLQESTSFYVVSDGEYERLVSMGEEVYSYHYRIEDLTGFSAAKTRLDAMTEPIRQEGSYVGRIAIDPEHNDLDWVKVLYSICVFMFLVFILAGGSMMFMKVYNDAFEENGRYAVMRKMGLDSRVLKKAAAKELGVAYGLPCLVMGVSSWFSVRALANMMFTDLTMIHLVSVSVVVMIFGGCYGLSVRAYEKYAGIIT